MFKTLFEGFQYKRMALGIAIFAMGHPVIFFLRDGLKLAPQSSAFTAACLVIGLFLMIPSTIFQKYYSLNPKIGIPVLGWMGVCLFYLFFLNANPANVTKELINYLTAFAFLFMLLSVPDEVKDYALPVFIIFILAGNLGLFYSLATNPHYVVGARASIYFDDEYGGNPHVFARNGFAGVIGSAILLFMTKEYWLYKFIAFINLFCSLLAVLLTQSRATLLSVILSICILLFFHFRISTLKKIGKSLMKPVNFLILLGVIYFIVYKVTTSSYTYLLLGIFDAFVNKLLDAFETGVQGADAEEIADYSALQRVISWNMFKNQLFYGPAGLILGAGYKYMYMDFPILEAAYNYGISGIYFFGRSVYEIVKDCYRSIKTIVNPFLAFLGFTFIPITVSVFSGGQPSDTTYLFPFLLMARFMDFDKEVALLKKRENVETLEPVA